MLAQFIYMPTAKTRINLSVPDNLDRVLHRLAKRDDLSVASKALDLINRAVELEEDEVFLQIAKARESKKKIKYLSHEKTWKQDTQ